MFNNKTVTITGYIIATYLLLKMLLTIIMYVWAMVDVPPLPIINPESPGALLTLLDTIAIYAVEIVLVGLIVKYMVAPVKGATDSSCVCPPVKAAPRKIAKKK